MGIYYTIALRVGFELSQEETIRPFLCSSQTVLVKGEEGVFHMENRFDPKTGKQIDPVKVWDVKPVKQKLQTSTWLEIAGKTMNCDTDISRILERMLSCKVEMRCDYEEGYTGYVFCHHSFKETQSGGKFDTGNSFMLYSEVVAMQPKLIELKEKMEKIGWVVGEPTVFICQNSG